MHSLRLRAAALCNGGGRPPAFRIGPRALILCTIIKMHVRGDRGEAEPYVKRTGVGGAKWRTTCPDHRLVLAVRQRAPF